MICTRNTNSPSHGTQWGDVPYLEVLLLLLLGRNGRCQIGNLWERTGQTKPREDIGGNPHRTSASNGEHIAARQGRVPTGAVVAHTTIIGQGHCVRELLALLASSARCVIVLTPLARALGISEV
mmetsp:Transcript_26834/g.64380  ORF Transcript_26834/g.64380 Transcript_26834/m.64380 type:complete len:124 (+) Transcript_26834:245-616(+)